MVQTSHVLFWESTWEADGKGCHPFFFLFFLQIKASFAHLQTKNKHKLWQPTNSTIVFF